MGEPGQPTWKRIQDLDPDELAKYRAVFNSDAPRDKQVAAAHAILRVDGRRDHVETFDRLVCRLGERVTRRKLRTIRLQLAIVLLLQPLIETSMDRRSLKHAQFCDALVASFRESNPEAAAELHLLAAQLRHGVHRRSRVG